MAAGFRSPVLPLALASPPAVTNAGYRSLLAFWAGGATSFTPTVSQPGYRGLLAFWAGGAGTSGGVEPPEPPVVTPGAGGGFFPRPGPSRQYARLHPFEEQDRFNRLLTRPGLVRARLLPWAERDLYGRLQAAARAYAAIKPVDHTDEYKQLLAQRGLPSKALLAFLMAQLYKH